LKYSKDFLLLGSGFPNLGPQVACGSGIAALYRAGRLPSIFLGHDTAKEASAKFNGIWRTPFSRFRAAKVAETGECRFPQSLGVSAAQTSPIDGRGDQ
jgi:hypothetical protein